MKLIDLIETAASDSRRIRESYVPTIGPEAAGEADVGVPADSLDKILAAARAWCEVIKADRVILGVDKFLSLLEGVRLEMANDAHVVETQLRERIQALEARLRQRKARR